jgi:hypothetical protein
LPGLDVEIVHHQSPDGLTERVSINLTAVPSFEAFARSIDAWNPFAFWAEAMRLAWSPLGRGHTHYDEGSRPLSIAAESEAGAESAWRLLDKRNGLVSHQPCEPAPRLSGPARRAIICCFVSLPEAICLLDRNGESGIVVLYDSPDPCNRIKGSTYKADWIPVA